MTLIELLWCLIERTENSRVFGEMVWQRKKMCKCIDNKNTERCQKHLKTDKCQEQIIVLSMYIRSLNVKVSHSFSHFLHDKTEPFYMHIFLSNVQ